MAGVELEALCEDGAVWSFSILLPWLEARELISCLMVTCAVASGECICSLFLICHLTKYFFSLSGFGIRSFRSLCKEDIAGSTAGLDPALFTHTQFHPHSDSYNHCHPIQEAL